MAASSGGETGYRTPINSALREYLDGKAPKFEEALRRIIREELKSSAAWHGISQPGWLSDGGAGAQVRTRSPDRATAGQASAPYVFNGG